jgi:MiaB/RimO family radical SAM methylthiotransferase
VSDAGVGVAPRKADRYYIETWGCQMNVLDADKMSGALERHGYVRVASVDQADVVLLNTCSIREKAKEKVFSELGRLKPVKDLRPDVVLGVCGCVAQQEGAEIFSRAPYVDFVLGTRATRSLPILVDRLRAGDESARHAVDVEFRDDSIAFPYDQIRRDIDGAAKAFVTIIEGCNHRCTFCIVPQTRGSEITRDMDDVLDEVRALAARGFREVEFLGQTVNAYRDASGRTLGDLLVAAARVDGIERIRFTTSHPAQMTDRLMDAMIEAFDIEEYLSTMVCADDGIPAKPQPDMVLTICQRMNIDPSKVMVVGDTTADLKMARAAGAGLVVGVLSGVSSSADLIHYADVLIESVDELHAYVGALAEHEAEHKQIGLNPDFAY